LIRYATGSAATNAIRTMDGTDVEGKKILVKYADNNPPKDKSTKSDRIENKQRYDEPKRHRSEERDRISPRSEHDFKDYRRSYQEEMRLRRLEERERSPVEIVDDITDRKRKVDAVDSPAQQGSQKRSNIGNGHIQSYIEDEYIPL
jgi:RNA recognition motif-containing protein